LPADIKTILQLLCGSQLPIFLGFSSQPLLHALDFSPCVWVARCLPYPYSLADGYITFLRIHPQQAEETGLVPHKADVSKPSFLMGNAKYEVYGELN